MYTYMNMYVRMPENARIQIIGPPHNHMCLCLFVCVRVHMCVCMHIVHICIMPVQKT